MVLKTIILLAAYIIPYLFLIFYHLTPILTFIVFIIMGLSMAGIGMSIMHDANHGAYSKSPLINKFLGYTLNMLGVTVFNWKLQHNVLHHTYTNIYDMDDDIDGPPIVRFSPHHPLKKIHKYQHIYVFFFYSILTLYWFFAKDFIQLIEYKKNGLSRSNTKEHFKNILIIIFSKLFYVFYIFFVPFVFCHYNFWLLLFSFISLHLLCGLILSVTFQLAHSVENASFPLPNTNNEVENDWAIHQINTTVDFSRKSRFLNWYLGGLNFQIEHHLFPTICHIHYKALSEIVKKTANEFEIPYLENKSFFSALRSHLNILKSFGSSISSAQ